MKVKIAIAIFIVLAVVGGLVGIKYLQIQTMMNASKGAGPPPETISSVVAKEDTWQGTLSAIGSVNAAQGVTITPDIPGVVREIAFEAGSIVAKDDLLVKLDTSSEVAQ